MKNYLKLLNFEFNRIFKVYLSFIILVTLVQVVGAYLNAKGYLTEMNRILNEQAGLTQAGYAQEYGLFSFGNIASSWLFTFPIILFFAAICLYVIYIWYRDWFGKNTFIYRLLMLPTARINIFFAKATTIFLGILGAMALQIGLLAVIQKMIKLIIPVELRVDYPLIEMISYFDYEHILYPYMWGDLIINIIVIITAVFVIFTIILLERSFRIKGLFYGIIYGCLSFLIFFSQLFVIAFMEENYLYPLENLLVQIGLTALVIGASLFLSNYLLRRKITV